MMMTTARCCPISAMLLIYNMASPNASSNDEQSRIVPFRSARSFFSFLKASGVIVDASEKKKNMSTKTVINAEQGIESSSRSCQSAPDLPRTACPEQSILPFTAWPNQDFIEPQPPLLEDWEEIDDKVTDSSSDDFDYYTEKAEYPITEDKTEETNGSHGAASLEEARIFTEWEEVQSCGSEYVPEQDDQASEGEQLLESSGSEWTPDHDDMHTSEDEQEENEQEKPSSTNDLRGAQDEQEEDKQEKVSSATQGDGSSRSGVKVKTSDGKWNKHHACKYCLKLVIKMSDHLERKHKEEIDVRRVLAMEKGSLCRKRAWAELVKKGDYMHNFKELQKGDGEYIPKYRSGKERKVEDFVPCFICKGSYKRSLLYLHVKRCAQEHNVSVSEKRKEAIVQGELLNPIAQVLSSFREKVLHKMKDDHIREIVLKDTLILQHGERKFMRKDVQEHTPNVISSRMRLLGKVVNVLQENNIMTLTEALHAAHFTKLLAAVQKVCAFDEEAHLFKKGHSARSIGYSLQHCCSILKSEAAKTQNVDLMEQATGFEAAFSGDWSDYISSCALQSIETHKFNTQKLLPTCQDVEKLYLYLKKMSADADSSEGYSDLAQRTLCQIHMLNRKRGGEVQRMKVADFEKGMKQAADVDPVVKASLNAIEIRLADLLQRIEIRGKFGRRVAILLTPQMCRNLEKLLQLRKEEGISSPYMFATKTGERPIRGSDVIRTFAKKADLENPELFTWTRLRKQVATISQVMEITDTDQDLLAKFLDHDIRVHRDYYRLPVSLLQKAKVAKMLLAANCGADLSAKRLKEELDSETMISPDEDLPHFDNEDEEQHLSDEEGMNEASTYREIQRPASKRGGSNKQKWSNVESAAVRRQLQPWIEMCRVPKKQECEDAIIKEPSLAQRNWKAVKFFVYNLIQKKVKKSR